MCSSTEDVQERTPGSSGQRDAVCVDCVVAHNRRPTPAVRLNTEEWSPEYETRTVKLKLKELAQEKIHAGKAAHTAAVSTVKIDPVLLALTLKSKRHVIDDDTPKLSSRRVGAAENFLQKEQHILAGQLSMVKLRLSKLAEETHSPRSAQSQSHRDSASPYEDANQSRSSSHDTDRELSASGCAAAVTVTVRSTRKLPAEGVVLNAERSSVYSIDSSASAMTGVDAASVPSEIAVLC